MKTSDRVRFALLAIVGLDLAGFGMIVADIQFRLDDMGLEGWAIGAVLSSMFLVQLPASYLWGRAADRAGRKRVILICTLLSAASMVVYALAIGPEGVLASRLLAGLGAANVAMAYAYGSSATEGQGRASLMGQLGAASVLGLSAGSALGGIAVEAGGQALLGFSACGLSLLGAIGALFLPETGSRPSPQSAAQKGLASLSRPVRAVLGASFIGWMALAVLEGTFGRLIKANFGWEQMEFGLIFGYESVISFLVQALAFAWIARKHSSAKILSAAFLATGAGLAAMPFAFSLVPLIGAATVFAAASGMTNPAINDLASSVTKEAQKGEVFGLMQSLRSLGFVVGPSVGGLLFDLNPAAPYLAAGVLCIAAASFCWLRLQTVGESE